MTVFLWVMAGLGFWEFIGSAYYVGTGKIPVRTPKSMVVNGVFMLALGAWSFWLAVNA